MAEAKTSYLNWRVCLDFIKLNKLMTPSWKSDSFICLCGALLMAGTEEFLAYKVGLLTGKFYKVLGEKDTEDFIEHVVYSLVILLSISLLKSLKMFLIKILAVVWRKHLTKAMHELYFSDLRFYKLTSLGDHKIDNPDQRIASDVNILCSTFGTLISDLVLSPILIIYYAYDAYTRADWVGPTGIFGYFLLSLILNRLLMTSVVRATVQLEKREGNFRFAHASIRSSSESLAFCGQTAATFEQSQQNQKLQQVCQAQYDLCKCEFFLELATNCSSYLSSIASFLIIAPAIFSGSYDHYTAAEMSQVISENAFVCMYLSFQLSKVVEMSVKVSHVLGVSFRINEMIQELKNRESSADNPSYLTSQLPDAIAFKVHNMSVFTPDGQQTCLVDALTLELKKGSNLLISGQSSSGKTSLMRVLASLWPQKSGHLWLSENAYFMPQNSYLCYDDVTLRQQLAFPETNFEHFLPDADMKELILNHGLGHLLVSAKHDLDQVPFKEWVKKLSPGERQTLAFLRLFWHKPQLAFLDEASSALSVTSEQKLYEQCQAYGIQLVSIGHRPSLRQYHQVMLTLGLPSGSWTLTEIRPALKPDASMNED